MVKVRHRFSPLQRPLALLLLCFLALAGAVSVANPLFESTDETRHYRYVRILVTDRRLPVQGSESARSQSHHPPLYYALSAVASAWVPSSHNGDFQQPANPFWGYRSFEPGVDNKLQYWHGPAEPFREGYLAALIPRWVNCLLGAATVLATYVLAERVLRASRSKASPDAVWTPADRAALAVAAASIVALNPQFIYLSAAINNDVIAALTGTAILLACVVALQDGLTWRNLIALGLASGLGLMAKLQVGALGSAVALTLALAALRSRDRRPWLPGFVRGLAAVGVVTLLISGWWFWRNLRLYGEPTGLSMVEQLWGGREPSAHLWAIWQGLPQLWASLWGRFGYGQIPLPGWITALVLLASLACLSGLVRSRRPRLASAELALLLTAIAATTATVLYYMAANPAGAMGRFLFPVLPGFAILLVAGLAQWLGRPIAVRAVTMGGMLLFALAALGGVLWPAVTYPRREPRLSDAPAVATVGDVAEILSVDMGQAEVGAGEPVYIRVVWRPLHWTSEPLTVFVHLIDEAGILVAQRDTWPGLGRAPTTSWRAALEFADTYRVDLPDTIYTPNRLSVHLGLYGAASGRLPIVAGSAPAVDSWGVGSVTVRASDAQAPNPIAIDFGSALELVGYQITPRVLAAGETFTLTTVWQLRNLPAADIQLFAQVFDSQYRVWGSTDGGHPDWAAGVVTDTRRITLIPETPAGAYPVNVGVLADGERLAVLSAAGTPVGDFVPLGPIRVR